MCEAFRVDVQDNDLPDEERGEEEEQEVEAEAAP
jgi:hypothetical protein